MTLDEAIKKCENVVADFSSKEYKQLAEWLEELKEYKENKHRSLRYMYEKGYKKAIDETCNYICCEWSLDRINTCEDFDKISQQLKEDGIDEDR